LRRSPIFPANGSTASVAVVTKLWRPAERAVAFYNQRGTAEQWIKGRQERDQLDAAGRA
jgi:hypothetical protein